MNLSRRNFMKIAGLSAAAVAGAALPVHRLLRSAHAARPVLCYRDR